MILQMFVHYDFVGRCIQFECRFVNPIDVLPWTIISFKSTTYLNTLNFEINRLNCRDCLEIITLDLKT